MIAKLQFDSSVRNPGVVLYRPKLSHSTSRDSNTSINQTQSYVYSVVTTLQAPATVPASHLIAPCRTLQSATLPLVPICSQSLINTVDNTVPLFENSAKTYTQVPRHSKPTLPPTMTYIVDYIAVTLSDTMQGIVGRYWTP